MPRTAIYTDLSAYYDLMCADIDYSAQAEVRRRNYITRMIAGVTGAVAAYVVGEHQLKKSLRNFASNG